MAVRHSLMASSNWFLLARSGLPRLAWAYMSLGSSLMAWRYSAMASSHCLLALRAVPRLLWAALAVGRSANAAR